MASKSRADEHKHGKREERLLGCVAADRADVRDEARRLFIVPFGFVFLSGCDLRDRPLRPGRARRRRDRPHELDPRS